MVPYISTSVCDHAGVLRYYYLVPLTVYALEKNHHTYAYIANAQLLGERRFGARVIGGQVGVEFIENEAGIFDTIVIGPPKIIVPQAFE